MKYRFSTVKGAVGVPAGAVLCALLFFAPRPAASQDQNQSDENAKQTCIGCSVDGKTTPRLLDGHPDLNGFWSGPPPNPNAPPPGSRSGEQFRRGADGSILFDFSTNYNDENGTGRLCTDDACQGKNQPPYNEAYMAKVKQIAATEYGGTTPLDPQMDCRPLGVPRTGVNNMQIVQTPQQIALLFQEAPYSDYRIIYMDGRQHPTDLDTSYMGDSVGHWEGDTLVVDVVGLNDETWLGGDVVGRAKYTSIHSEKEHVVERWMRTGNTLTYEATVYDPDALTKPWVIGPRRVQHDDKPDDAILETVCTPNYKQHFVLPKNTDPDIRSKCGYRCDDSGSAAK